MKSFEDSSWEDDFDVEIETQELLSDPEFMEKLELALAQRDAGLVIDGQEVLESLLASGRFSGLQKE